MGMLSRWVKLVHFNSPKVKKAWIYLDSSLSADVLSTEDETLWLSQ